MYRRLALALILPCARLLAAEASPVDAVNVFTGTSNSRWAMFPGPTLPFGLVKLSPDNQGNVWNGGYEYTVQSISGFSHLHTLGLGGLSIMPVTGPMEYNQGLYRVFPGAPDGPFGNMWTSGYRSRILKETERGSPGYYGVELFDWKVKAEATATTRCGVLKFTFHEANEAHLVLDFAFPTEELSKILGVTVRQTGPAEIEGVIHQHNQYAGDNDVYFVLRTDRPFQSIDSWQRGPFTGNSTNYGTDWQTPVDYRKGISNFAGHDQCGVVVNFAPEKGDVIQVHTGISLNSLEGARKNLKAELDPMGWDFGAVVENARRAWGEQLGAIDITGGTDEQRSLFYTCLYRSYSAKSVIQDVDGGFTDYTGAVKQGSPASAVYSSDSVWGCQWTLFPLWTLVSPSTASSWDNFLVESAKRGGWITQAPVRGGYSPIMVAQHQQSLIVSSYQKGIRDFDTQGAYAAIRHDLTTQGTPMPNGGFAGDRNMAAYMAHGYVPDEAGPTSNTFEYAYDDWAAGQFAGSLGKNDDLREFQRRSGFWRNNIDPQTGYARRRLANGSWSPEADLFKFGTTGGWNGPGFVEGNAWLYSFYVPQDPAGLIALVGKDEFNRRLVEGFDKNLVDLTNEENLQAPFLFNYSGKPWLTQKYVRQSLRQFWDPSPLVGWVGEEDEGQLSALYVLWSMGLFEMDGGCSMRPSYDLSGPLFDRVVIHLDPKYYPGGKFVIEAHHNGPGSPYIQSALLNGKPLNEAKISHEALVSGGTLEFEMGPNPNPGWGDSPGNHPHAMNRRDAIRTLAGAAALLPLGMVASAADPEKKPGTPSPLPRLQVHPSGHFLQTDEGKPFFWLGDTAWQLIHDTTPDECSYYLHTRSVQGFNVIQTVVLSEFDGLNRPDEEGQRPLFDNDPARPNEAYFNRVVAIVDEAAREGLYVALVPTWGDKLTAPWGAGPRIFTLDNLPEARGFARYLSSLLSDRPNVVWLLGGDRPARIRGMRNEGLQKTAADAGFPPDQDWTPIWRELAAGLAEGLGRKPFIIYHPQGGEDSSSVYLGSEPWLSVNGMQSGHGGGHDLPVWRWIARDYALSPAKPTLDLEPNYEDHPFNPWPRWDPSTGYFRDHDVRKQTYRSVLAGGCGVTYGHHAVWQFAGPRREVINHADRSWTDALWRPAGRQMRFLRSLVESRPYFSRIPDQGLIQAGAGEGGEHIQAARDANGSYAFVYFPHGDLEATIDLSRLKASSIDAWWYDTQNGIGQRHGQLKGGGIHAFRSPPSGVDWVLVLDDAAAGYLPPGLGVTVT